MYDTRLFKFIEELLFYNDNENENEKAMPPFHKDR